MRQNMIGTAKGISAVVAALALLLVFLSPSFARDYPAGRGTRSIVSSDLDLDGDLDLVVANSYDGTISVFKNDGAGAFSVQCVLAVGNFPMSLAVADLNGDSLPEIVCANYISGSVTVVQNQGSLAFGSGSEYFVGAGTMDVAIGDVTGDGQKDIISADYEAGTISVISSGVISSIAAPNGPGSICLANVDGDLDLEILASFTSTNQVIVYDKNGTVFAPAFEIAVPGHPRVVSASDLDIDGTPEIISAGFDTNMVYVFDGPGFAVRMDLLVSGVGPSSIEIADVDGNGLGDIVVALSSSYTVQILGQDALGSFTATAPVATGSLPLTVVSADLNGDGIVDLASANFNADSMSVLLNGVEFNYSYVPEPTVASYSITLEAVNAAYDHEVKLVLASDDLSEFTVEMGGSSVVIDGDGELVLFNSTHASEGLTVLVTIISSAPVSLVPAVYVKNTGVTVLSSDIFCQIVSDSAGSLYAFEDLKGQDWIDWDYNDAVISVNLV